MYILLGMANDINNKQRVKHASYINVDDKTISGTNTQKKFYMPVSTSNR